jgi:hypothetical protein
LKLKLSILLTYPNLTLPKQFGDFFEQSQFYRSLNPSGRKLHRTSSCAEKNHGYKLKIFKDATILFNKKTFDLPNLYKMSQLA